MAKNAICGMKPAKAAFNGNRWGKPGLIYAGWASGAMENRLV
ncbi:hypothetical protein ACFOSS_14555 [Pseudaeromonas sharmana]|uniref:Uncharacterized protein n=1 Tax=Pseudaeromonas sharmana TaxID=328412 RepID=A0ABV8CR30_9GAMM